MSALFDLPAESAPGPRCRMCPRPARWIPKFQQFSAYCTGRNCTNTSRICRACGELFDLNTGDAGTKYCSSACKAAGYRPLATRPTPNCAWCGAPGTRHRGGIWPYICSQCLEPIKHVLGRLRDHRVPHEMVRRLVSSPTCAVCDRDILAKVPAETTGRLQARLVVDHDHSCCPGPKSCGRCVRGLLCRTCNSAAGLLQDDALVAARMAAYLSRPAVELGASA